MQSLSTPAAAANATPPRGFWQRSLGVDDDDVPISSSMSTTSAGVQSSMSNHGKGWHAQRYAMACCAALFLLSLSLYGPLPCDSSDCIFDDPSPNAAGRQLAAEPSPLGRGDQLSMAQSEHLKGHLREWAKLITGKAQRYECRNASVPRAVFRKRRTALAARGYGTRDADNWHVCYDEWEPWKVGCLGISVGIGGEWGFEDGLAQQTGCDVYAFDPTEDLANKHRLHAVDEEQNGRMHFEAAGLGGEVAQANTKSKRYGSFNPNKTAILPLSALVQRTMGTAAKRQTPIVDVLKIDCEGCVAPNPSGSQRPSEPGRRERQLVAMLHAVLY